jgi:hypothetical protein
MLKKLFPALLASTMLLGGCAQNTPNTAAAAPEKGDEDFMIARNARADQVYVNIESGKGGRVFREIFIAPVKTSNIQIIQPEGVKSDDSWSVDDIEDGVLQNAVVKEFGEALSFESAYNIVNSREDADMIIHTTIVAIHPNEGRTAAAASKTGGAITVSVALINAKTGEVMVRSVDTKSTDNIWAFNNLEQTDPAVNLIFRAWGNSMRRGILHLQGRSSDPTEEPLQLKPQ